jgi:hypothetical protein
VKRRTEHGMLLLPVALMLTIIGALTYTMTREGAMSVSAVNADYDTEVARYLAEGGLNLARWQNEKFGCLAPVAFGRTPLPGGQVAVDAITRGKGGAMNISLTATTTGGAVHELDNYKVTTYNRFRANDVTINGPGNNDITITVGMAPSVPSSQYLEASDDKSRALLKFDLPKELDNASIVSAYLTLTQYDTKSTQTPRSLSVHRVTQTWDSGSTWAQGAPWATAGGNFDPTPVATVAIAGNDNYTWRIDSLVEGWDSGTILNQGILLKSSGLLDARFYSLDAPSNKPKLVVSYYPRCP